METGSRTFVKAIIWNVIGLLSMGLVGFLVTGSVATGGGIAVVNTLIGLMAYVAYERVWSRINWGLIGRS